MGFISSRATNANTKNRDIAAGGMARNEGPIVVAGMEMNDGPIVVAGIVIANTANDE
jgi:hypothetical protein